MPPIVLITRPEAAAQSLADQIRNRWGVETPVVISPLMEIIHDDTAFERLDAKTLIFTSRHGVEAFARLSRRRDLPCYVVGKTTADVATELGFLVEKTVDDAEALVASFRQHDRADPILHLRGEYVAGDIVTRLVSEGFSAREHVIYRQQETPLSNEAISLLDQGHPVLLPLYSPRSALLFFKQCSPKAPLFVAAISENTAAGIPTKLVKMMIVAESPDANAMFQAMDQLRQNAIRLEGAKRAQ